MRCRKFRELSSLAASPLLLATLLSPPARALQVVEARDGVAVEAILSIREVTRIRIEGEPITDVVGHFHSSNCGPAAQSTLSPGVGATTIASPAGTAVNPSGEIVLECDRDKGEIYIRPVLQTPDGAGKPINLFVSSANATYTLVLRRSDTPADTILLRDKSRPSDSTSVAQPAGPLGSSPNHIRAMKSLLVAMASDRVPGDVRVDVIGQPIQLWTETRFALLRRFETRGLIGERYALTNTSPSPLLLAEQHFDRSEDGDGTQVLGVAIEQHRLQPGESTAVYVIRRGAQR